MHLPSDWPSNPLSGHGDKWVSNPSVPFALSGQRIHKDKSLGNVYGIFVSLVCSREKNFVKDTQLLHSWQVVAAVFNLRLYHLTDATIVPWSLQCKRTLLCIGMPRGWPVDYIIAVRCMKNQHFAERPSNKAGRMGLRHASRSRSDHNKSGTQYLESAGKDLGKIFHVTFRVIDS
jgi:hypothetical protein